MLLARHFNSLSAACGLALTLASAAVAQPPSNGNYALPNDICGCGDAMGVCLDGAPHTERMWVRGEALIWQLEGQVLPALFTFTPLSTAEVEEAGRLDRANTFVLTGTHVVNDDWRAGWGLSGGFWVDDCRQTAVVWDYLQVGRQTFDSRIGSVGAEPNYIGRPFLNVQTSQQDADLIAGVFQSEVVMLNATTRRTETTTTFQRGVGQAQAYEDFYSAGIAMQHRFRELSQHCEVGHSGQMSWLLGYRHYHDDSFLGITTEDSNTTVIEITNTQLQDLTTTTSSTTTVLLTNVSDQFGARNDFHGAELGLTARVERWGWWLEGLGTLSLGSNRRVVDLRGRTTTANATQANNNVLTPVSDTASGLLVTQSTNAGRYSDSQATVIPRLRGGVGCQITPRLSLRSGYSAIIWPDAVRAADHLPPGLAVDVRNLPGATNTTGATDNPNFPGIQGRTIVAHGFDMALELRY